MNVTVTMPELAKRPWPDVTIGTIGKPNKTNNKTKKTQWTSHVITVVGEATKKEDTNSSSK